MSTKGVLYVGYNPGAAAEAQALQKALGPATPLRVITNDRQPAPPLPSPAKEKAAALLQSADESSRDELQKLIGAFADADAGRTTLDELVLSGHGLWDEKNAVSEIEGELGGRITYEQIAQLCTIFPTAASQVHHLMMSSCASGNEPVLDFFRGVFPNLETFKGYIRSPSGRGAENDIADFAAATEGALRRPSNLAARLAVATGVAWTKESKTLRSGELTFNALSNAQLEATVAQLWPRYLEYMSARPPAADPHDDQSMIRLEYMLFTRLGRGDLTPAKHDALYQQYLAARMLRSGV